MPLHRLQAEQLVSTRTGNREQTTTCFQRMEATLDPHSCFLTIVRVPNAHSSTKPYVVYSCQSISRKMLCRRNSRLQCYEEEQEMRLYSERFHWLSLCPLGAIRNHKRPHFMTFKHIYLVSTHILLPSICI